MKEKYAAKPKKIKIKTSWYHLKQWLGPDGRRRMLEAQSGGCAFCGILECDAPGGKLVVDHEHATQKIRWLLCQHCNTGLGMFKENPTVMRKAAAMLELIAEEW